MLLSLQCCLVTTRCCFQPMVFVCFDWEIYYVCYACCLGAGGSCFVGMVREPTIVSTCVYFSHPSTENRRKRVPLRGKDVGGFVLGRQESATDNAPPPQRFPGQRMSFFCVGVCRDSIALFSSSLKTACREGRPFLSSTLLRNNAKPYVRGGGSIATESCRGVPQMSTNPTRPPKYVPLLLRKGPLPEYFGFKA